MFLISVCDKKEENYLIRFFFLIKNNVKIYIYIFVCILKDGFIYFSLNNIMVDNE